jgi:hypothetical protein
MGQEVSNASLGSQESWDSGLGSALDQKLSLSFLQEVFVFVETLSGEIEAPTHPEWGEGGWRREGLVFSLFTGLYQFTRPRAT